MTTTDESERENFLAMYKEAGRKIDPETADIKMKEVCQGDPYEIYSYSEIPPELNVGDWQCFFRSPGSDIWVNESDIPEITREALWKKTAKWEEEVEKRRTGQFSKIKTKQLTDSERENFLAMYKEAGRKIDPETADIATLHCCMGDPYGVFSESEISPELYKPDKQFFFRAHGSDLRVNESDVPKATLEAWRKRIGEPVE